MDLQAVTVPELLQWFAMIRDQRSKLLAEGDYDMDFEIVLDMTTAMRDIIEKMVFQAVTVPELLQWFDMIRVQRLKLLAECELDIYSAQLVPEITTAMGEMTAKMVSLIHGTSLATASQLDPSSSAETTGFSATTVQENNKPAGTSEPHLVHQSDQSPAPSPAKESRPTETAGPLVATSQENNKPATTVTSKAFHEISFPPMPVAAENSQVASSAGHSVAQDQLPTPTEGSKKAKRTSKASRKEKPKKKAREANSSAGNQAETRIAE